MAKFLSKFSNLNIKNLIDKRLQHSSSFDTDDLLKFMGVRSESEGLRKLFKVLGNFLDSLNPSHLFFKEFLILWC